MLPNHNGLAQALDAGKLDVFALEHLEHARPRQAHEARGQESAEGDHGQHVVLGSAHAAGRQPAQLDAEEKDQDDAKPETGRGDAEHRNRPCRAIEEAAPVERRNDAEGNPDQHGKQHRPGNDCERIRQAGKEYVYRRLAHAQRRAEIAVQHAADERDILREERAIEAHRFDQVRTVLGRRILWQH